VEEAHAAARVWTQQARSDDAEFAATMGSIMAQHWAAMPDKCGAYNTTPARSAPRYPPV